jgi:hypothetical protein
MTGSMFHRGGAALEAARIRDLETGFLKARMKITNRWEDDGCPIPARHRLQGP